MQIIRRLSVGPDYKNGAMHFIRNQKVLGDTHVIHEIRGVESDFGVCYEVWVKGPEEKVKLWKVIENMPVMVEMYIDF
jgi:hypothetical protein